VSIAGQVGRVTARTAIGRTPYDQLSISRARMREALTTARHQPKMSAMKRRVKEVRANSLIDAISHAQWWMKECACSDICWFRGTKDVSLPLMPGAYRRADYNEFSALLQFSQEGRAFADVGEVDDWKTYYLCKVNGH
jgi:hypothetical protein